MSRPGARSAERRIIHLHSHPTDARRVAASSGHRIGGGRRVRLWRAVQDEGKVLDMSVHMRRNKSAALKRVGKLLKNMGVHSESIPTDKFASYGAIYAKIDDPIPELGRVAR